MEDTSEGRFENSSAELKSLMSTNYPLFAQISSGIVTSRMARGVGHAYSDHKEHNGEIYNNYTSIAGKITRKYSGAMVSMGQITAQIKIIALDPQAKILSDHAINPLFLGGIDYPNTGKIFWREGRGALILIKLKETGWTTWSVWYNINTKEMEQIKISEALEIVSSSLYLYHNLDETFIEFCRHREPEMPRHSGEDDWEGEDPAKRSRHAEKENLGYKNELLYRHDLS